MRFNTTVVNTSPSVDYTPHSAWEELTLKDPELGQLEQSHHTTSSNGSLSFSWRGTGIWFYGSSSGKYQISVDGNTTTYMQRKDGNNSELLFGVENLDRATHSVTLANLDQRLDFDYLVFESDMDDTNWVNSTTSSGDSEFEFISPGSGHWIAENGSHFTNSYGTALLKFSGACVFVYGNLLGNGTRLRIQIDSQEQQRFVSNAVLNSSPQLLFFADELSSGDHVLKMTHDPGDGAGSLLRISHAEILSKSVSGSSSRTAVISGTTVASAMLVFLAFSFFWWMRVRSRRRDPDPRASLLLPHPFLLTSGSSISPPGRSTTSGVSECKYRPSRSTSRVYSHHKISRTQIPPQVHHNRIPRSQKSPISPLPASFHSDTIAKMHSRPSHSARHVRYRDGENEDARLWHDRRPVNTSRRDYIL